MHKNKEKDVNIIGNQEQQKIQGYTCWVSSNPIKETEESSVLFKDLPMALPHWELFYEQDRKEIREYLGPPCIQPCIREEVLVSTKQKNKN